MTRTTSTAWWTWPATQRCCGRFSDEVGTTRLWRQPAGSRHRQAGRLARAGGAGGERRGPPAHLAGARAGAPARAQALRRSQAPTGGDDMTDWTRDDVRECLEEAA